MQNLSNIIAISQCILFTAFLVAVVYLVVNVAKESLTLKIK